MMTFLLYYFAAVGLALQIAGMAFAAMILWHERAERRHPTTEALNASA